MSDFLSRLLERASGEPMGLLRRRPSLFEPHAVAPGLAAPVEAAGSRIEPVQLEAHEELVASASNPPRQQPAMQPATAPPPVRSAPPSALQPAQTPERGEDASPGASSQPSLPPAVSVAADRPRPPEHAALPASLASVEPHRPSVRMIEPELRSEARPSSAVSVLVRTAAPHAPPSPGEPPSRPAAVRHSDRPGLAPAGSATLPTFAPLPRHAIPRLRPNVTVAADRPAVSPTIHVTIGRVEVRAVASQPVAAHRQRPAGPRLSLEEYLKLRAGGGT